jgi:hypothetical protein
VTTLWKRSSLYVIRTWRTHSLSVSAGAEAISWDPSTHEALRVAFSGTRPGPTSSISQRSIGGPSYRRGMFVHAYPN